MGVGAFGAHSPRALRASLWYLTTKCLGMRGRQESRQLKWGDFTRKTDEWGNEFLEFNERTTKTRQGLGDTRPFHPKMWANCRNPERCPLYLYKEYERHRPYDMREPESPFYFGVNFKRAPSAECWFQRQPMGKNSLGTMMKVTAEKAGIKGKFTNHSTRRTSISQLMAHEVPPRGRGPVKWPQKYSIHYAVQYCIKGPTGGHVQGPHKFRGIP